MKKVLIFTFLALLLTVTSCGKKTFTVTLDADGGTCNVETIKVEDGKTASLPTPEKTGFKFEGWFDGTQKYTSSTKITKDVTLKAKWEESNNKIYEPKRKINEYYGFDGDGMTIKVAVLPVNEFDPFDTGYNGTDKAIRQKHMRYVESKYNIAIGWEAWDSNAPWGPERVKWVKDKYLSKELQNNGIYILNLTSQWIPTLVQAGVLASMGNSTNTAGTFTEIEHVQEIAMNDAMAVNGQVYGYGTGKVRPDYFLYYNYDLAQQAGMEDPAELWFRGEWTTSKFDEWIAAAQTNLNAGATDKRVLGVGFAEFVIGMVASTGGKLVQVKPANVLFERQSVTSVFDKIQTYWASNYYATERGVQDVTPSFNEGRTIFQHGQFWFLQNSERFIPVSEGGVNVGVVPYPAADDYGSPVYTDNQEEAIFEYDGKYISGLELNAETSFRIPFTGTSCFSVINLENGKNGLNSSVLTNIIVDIYAGQGVDPDQEVTLTEDEAYRNTLETKLSREIDVDVIMSVQGQTYFELLETLSMTVGDGSHFGPNGFWPLCGNICKSSTINPRTALMEVLDDYKNALRQLGYNVA